VEPELDFWLRAELCRDAVRALAEVLHSEGIRLLAIKGVHIAFAVSRTPSYRAMSDADVVVLDGDYRRAMRVLRGARRFRVRRDDWSASSVIDEHGRTVDVHRTALPAFFGAVRLDRLTARAIPRSDLFGPSVLIPEPADAAAIAVGHFVKDKLRASSHENLARDLEALEATGCVTPALAAARLDEHGLRRAGIVAFTAMETWERAEEWLEATKPTPRERIWARLVSAHLKSSGPRRPLGFLLARAIGDDARAIAASLTLGTAVRAPFIALEGLSSLYPSLRFL
jgi:hypothetical protein